MAAFVGLTLLLSGCGESEGIEEGATVTVYVAADACRQAQRVLASEGGETGSLRIRANCLPTIEKDGRLDLARIGANARLATEDSSTIAYIGETGPAATRFSETILEEAGIAQLAEMSGSVAMRKLLNAVAQIDTNSGSLRNSLNDKLR